MLTLKTLKLMGIKAAPEEGAAFNDILENPKFQTEDAWVPFIEMGKRVDKQWTEAEIAMESIIRILEDDKTNVAEIADVYDWFISRVAESEDILNTTIRLLLEETHNIRNEMWNRRK